MNIALFTGLELVTVLISALNDGFSSVASCDRYAADSVGADEAWSAGALGLDLSGAGVTIGMLDGGGVELGHPALPGALSNPGGDPVHPHATHVAGVMIAQGSQRPEVRGIAPGAQLHAWDGLRRTAAESATIVDETPIRLWNVSVVRGASHGWQKAGALWKYPRGVGNAPDPYFGVYDSTTALFDDVAYRDDKLMVFCANNVHGAGPKNQPIVHLHQDEGGLFDDLHPVNGQAVYPAPDPCLPGFGTVLPFSISKNGLTIGAVNHVAGGLHPDAHLIQPDSDGNRVPQIRIARFSGRGPTKDGRLKPDLVAPGMYVLSCEAGGFAPRTGTSQAAPMVTGAAALLMEHWHNVHGPIGPRASTLKALLIHAADDCGRPGPDYTHGWGMANVKASLDLVSLDEAWDEAIEEATVAAGGAWRKKILCDGRLFPKVTIVWTDPPGDGTGPALVHDLDVRLVRARTGTEWQPFVLDPLNPSNDATQGDNSRDNVECIDTSFNSSYPPAAGEYVIEVRHDGPGSDQDFSIVATGVWPLGLSRVASETSAGTHGDQPSYLPFLSEDGRYVAFSGFATNLVPDDLSSAPHAFLKDTQTGAIELVSVSTFEEPADGGCQVAGVSADGNKVVFLSSAQNLDTLPTNGVVNVFVRDVDAGTTNLVSVGANGLPAHSDCSDACISANGRVVAFATDSYDFVPGVGFSDRQVYAVDLITGTLDLVSRSAADPALPGDGDSRAPSLSRDGNLVTFASSATDLVAGGEYPGVHVYLANRSSGPTQLVSRSSQGDPVQATDPWIAADSYAISFTAIEGGQSRILVHDVGQQGTELVSIAPDSSEVTPAYLSRITPDGRFIIFGSAQGVIIRDRATATSFLVSLDALGQPRNVNWAGSVSADGRLVGYSEWSLGQVLVHDRLAPLIAAEPFEAEGADGVFVNEGDSYRLVASTRWAEEEIDLILSSRGQPVAAASDGIFDLIGWRDGSGFLVVSTTAVGGGLDGQATSRPVHVQVRTPLSLWRPAGELVDVSPGQPLRLPVPLAGWPLGGLYPGFDPTFGALTWYHDGQLEVGSLYRRGLFPLIRPADAGTYQLNLQSFQGPISVPLAHVNVAPSATPDLNWRPIARPHVPYWDNADFRLTAAVVEIGPTSSIHLEGFLDELPCPAPPDAGLWELGAIVGHPDGPLGISLTDVTYLPGGSVRATSTPGTSPFVDILHSASGHFTVDVADFTLPHPLPTSGETAVLKVAFVSLGLFASVTEPWAIRETAPGITQYVYPVPVTRTSAGTAGGTTFR